MNLFTKFFIRLTKGILRILFQMDLLPNWEISGSSANMTLSASKVLGTEKGGKTAVGINPGGNKDNIEAVEPKGEAPPNCDPGEGFPGGISSSVKSGRLGFITKEIAKNANANIRELYNSSNNVFSSELSEVVDEDDELLEQYVEYWVVRYE